MKKMSDKEIKDVLRYILNYIHEIAITNNINYSLIGGSLIGAIREHGMIEWDDDIDIILDKDNYEKLINKIMEDNNPNFLLLKYSKDNDYNYPFYKLIDVRTCGQQGRGKKINNYGVFVDIFQFYNFPNNKIIQLIHYSFIKISISLVHTLLMKEENIKSEKKLLKRLKNRIAIILGRNNIMNFYNFILNLYEKDNKCKYFISSWPVYGMKKEIKLKKDLAKYTIVKFDNIQAMITKNYDNVLKGTFGDYMTPPPLDKRMINHDLEMFWK